MAISKLILNGVTQMDLTTDTVTNSAHIMSGYIGHLADGTQVTGTGQGGGGSSGGDSYERIFFGTVTTYANRLFNIPELADYYPDEGETYRITLDGDESICETVYYTAGSQWMIGNPDVISGENDTEIINDPTAENFVIYNSGWGGLYGNIAGSPDGSDYSLKIEKLVNNSSSSGQTVTGTITGTGTSTLEIPCAFEPDLIHIYGDLTDDVTKRGIVHFTIIKDNTLYYGVDGSQSNSNVITSQLKITGYNESETSLPHALYSNGVLTITSSSNSSTNLWLSGQTYTYELGAFGSGSSAPSATQHTIHLGFSDSTSADINVYYDDTLLNTMITNYNPTIYGGKAVTLAQLDNVAWYEPLNIPLNTQLIDYTKCVNGYRVDSSGELTEEEWAWVSDYTTVDPSMTFSYIGYNWWHICFYDSSKTFISSFRMHDDDGVTIDNNDYAHGTLTPSKIPSNAMYIRIDALGNNSDSMSLIRTA